MEFKEICNIYAQQKASRFQEASEALTTIAMKGLSVAQAADLATALADSGNRIKLPASLQPFVDSPSTGGPASLSTLLCPLLIASLGIRVPKLSATGSVSGAIDSMSMLSGYKTHLSEHDFQDALSRAGFAHIEQTEDFCPADRALILARRKAGLMANKSLAAASLFGKKLVIPGTAAAFDFRVGLTGNIGATMEAATDTGQFFFAVARRLKISITILLTDNATFPSSALGRVESLQLLYDICRNPTDLSPLDAAHVSTCLTIAAAASHLANNNLSVSAARERLNKNLTSGAVYKVLSSHLDAQGSHISHLENLANNPLNRRQIVLQADGDGKWSAPDIGTAKDWVKRVQREASLAGHDRPEHQVGLRLVASPGDAVNEGDSLMVISLPVGLPVPSDLHCLRGEITDNPALVNHGLLAQL